MAEAEPKSGPTPSPTPTGENRLRAFFLGRLDYLVRLENGIPLTPEQKTFLPKAKYSTYLDCLNVGAGDQARDLLGPKPTKQTTSTEIPTSGNVFEARKNPEQQLPSI